MKWKIKLRNMSLDDLASLAAELQVRSSGESQYIDDNVSRYGQYISPKLGKKLIIELRPDEVFTVLNSNKPTDTPTRSSNMPARVAAAI